MRRRCLLIGVLLVLIPTFARAQFERRANDPVNYSLLFYPRFSGSHYAIFEMDVQRTHINSQADLHKAISRMGSIMDMQDKPMQFNGELIHTIDITESMLEQAIQRGFQLAGINGRRELAQLYEIASTIPPSTLTVVLDGLIGTGTDVAGAKFESASNALLGLKYAAKGVMVATTDAKFTDLFTVDGVLMDAVSIAASALAAEAAGTALGAAASVGGVVLVGVGGIMAAEAVREAWEKIDNINAEIANALAKIGVFYASTNECLKRDYANRDLCWKVVVNGTDQITGTFRNEPALVSWSLEGLIDKRVGSGSTVSDRDPRSFDGTYFGWLTSTVRMDMSSYDNYYIPVTDDGYMKEDATLGEMMTARHGVSMSDGIRNKANEAQYKYTKMDGGKFKHQQTQPTRGLLKQKLPVVLTISTDLENEYHPGHILRGTEVVDGKAPDIITVDKNFSIGHAFEGSVTMKEGDLTITIKEEGYEKSVGPTTVEQYYYTNLDEPRKERVPMENVFPVEPSNVGFYIGTYENIIEKK